MICYHNKKQSGEKCAPCELHAFALLRAGLTEMAFLLWSCGIPAWMSPPWQPEALSYMQGWVQLGLRYPLDWSVPWLGCIRGHRLIYFLLPDLQP